MRKHLKNYFIPSEDNDHKPHSLRNESVFCILAIAFLIEFAFIASVFTPIANVFKANLAAVLPSVLVMATNDERKDLSAPQLVTNKKLQAAAQLKADDMANRSFFSHVNPDGKQPWHYLQLAGYAYDAAGENLAVDFIDSKDVHKAWMNSPTHRANIIESQFSEIGIATSRGVYEDKDVIFVVQFFAKPKPAEKLADAFALVPVTSTTQVQETEPEAETVEPVSIAIETNSPTPQVLGSTDVSANGAEEINKVTENYKEEEFTASNKKASNEEIIEEDEIELPQPIVTYSVQQEASVLQTIAGSPYFVARILIYLVLLVVAIALILKITIKKHIQHKELIVNGTILIAALLLLLALNTVIVSGFGFVL